MEKSECKNLNCTPIRFETIVGDLVYQYKCSVCDRPIWIPISISLIESCPVPPKK